ncbi:MAG: VCBS repeat-containing protein [Planctomycetota bacterium]|nr:MAG: VCBS repeat-containing protein [Planctomycetota bacterium]
MRILARSFEADLLHPVLAIVVTAAFTAESFAQAADRPWSRHVIDNAGRGADGTRWADVNGDGLLDVVTGWEESGEIRLRLHPPREKVHQAWPGIVVGKVASPEDAVLVDLDGDGAMDVVTSCEGQTNSLFVHWAPRDRARLLDAAAWQTEAIPAAKNREAWMFAVPAQIDGRRGGDLFVGSKNRGGKNGRSGSVSWLQAPKNPRDLAAWKLRPIRTAGWIMSLVAEDFDRDGDVDVLVSDRKGERRGVVWLENPGRESVESDGEWQEHAIGAAGEEVMFLDLADMNGDGRRDVVATSKPRNVFVFEQLADPRGKWKARRFELSGNLGRAKAIRAADIDLDGCLDLVFTCEGATGGKSGVSWFRADGDAWHQRDISGTGGEKFDLVDLIDLDGDGDLDAITCEERDNLGVIWYENPARAKRAE